MHAMKATCSRRDQDRSRDASQDNARHVDPLIGVAGGNVIPGAILPHGLASVSPYSERGCYGLRAGDPIYGFGHYQLPSVGCAGLGAIVTMPSMGPVQYDRAEYRSPGANEVARPGYYAVRLTRFGIRAEMSATMRTGISRYSFPGANAHILLDVGARVHRFGYQHSDSCCRRVSDAEVEGWVVDGNFGKSETYYKVFFVLRVTAHQTRVRLWRDAEMLPAGTDSVCAPDKVGACVFLEQADSEPVIVQAGISFTSVENARLNLETEQPHVDFDGVRRRACETWRNALSHVTVEGGEESDRVKFYTGLYHALLMPHVIDDVNGEYRSMPNALGTGAVRTVHGRNRYSLFSLWDTYRSLHPLLALTHPRLQRDLVQSMVDMYSEGGWLPKWELAGIETGIMVGDPALIVIADTYLKGIVDFDVDTAYEGMVHNATGRSPEGHSPVREGLDEYLRYGYLPQDLAYPNPGGTLQTQVRGHVSITMECSYADWCLSRMADALGHKADRDRFAERGDYYQNLLDPASGFFRPRNADGSWFSPFDPLARTGGRYPGSGPGFVEGSAWDYRFFPPHGTEWIIDQMGGRERFAQALQHGLDHDLFRFDNEPAMAFPYLFNVVPGQEWRTHRAVRRLVDTLYSTERSGLPGDDDAGTLSAWLVFSMMGLYPDCPGKPRYQITAPCFDAVIMDLDGTNESLVIRTENNAPQNTAIESIILNGQSHTSYQINHQDIVNGGELKIILKPLNVSGGYGA
jgi:predicted alpha-1,2-mannosidase